MFPKLSSRISSFELCAFGITTVIGGQFIGWNAALQAGIGTFLLNFGLIGFGYLAMSCCLGEMCSTLQAPFAGALFCFTRAAFGRTVGFFLAVLEILEYIVYVASTLTVFGRQLTFAFGTDHRFEPLWWLLFFMIVIPAYLYGLKWFWKANILVAGLLIIQLLVYFLLAVSTPECSADHFYLSDAPLQFRGWESYSSSIPGMLWLFVGVEGLTLANEHLKHHQDTHKGLVACSVTLLFTALLPIFGSVTNPPGLEALSQSPFLLSHVFQYYGATAQGAVWFSIPATFYTAFGFVFLYSTLINSLARSAVIPEWFGNKPTEQPKTAMLVGSGLVYFLVLVSWLSTDDVTSTETLFSVFQIAAATVYIAQLAAFIAMRTDFSALGRTWQSPLGIWGAVIGLAIFSLVLLCAVVKESQGYKWIFLAAWFVPITLYYFLWGQYAKPASEEEIRAMFRMHTMRHTHLRRHKHKHSFRSCSVCNEYYCTGCRKKGAQKPVLGRLVNLASRGDFKCFNCKKVESRRSRSSNSTSPGRLSSSSDIDERDEEMETMLIAKSLDRQCIVAECTCRNFQLKSQKTCECGHFFIYHESYEEAANICDQLSNLKEIHDVTILEGLLGHIEKAKTTCIHMLDQRVEHLRHRIAVLRQQAVHENKLAEISKSKKKASLKSTEHHNDTMELIDIKPISPKSSFISSESRTSSHADSPYNSRQNTEPSMENKEDEITTTTATVMMQKNNSNSNNNNNNNNNKYLTPILMLEPSRSSSNSVASNGASVPNSITLTLDNALP